MAVEVYKLFQVLYPMFRDDVTLQSAGYFGGAVRSFMTTVPSGTPAPFIVVSLHASPNTNALGGYRVMARPTILIKATSSKSYDHAEAIMSRIDDLVTAREGAPYNQVHVGKLMRVEDYVNYEQVEGVNYYIIGGFYHNIVHQA